MAHEGHAFLKKNSKKNHTEVQSELKKIKQKNSLKIENLSRHGNSLGLTCTPH